VKGLSSLSSTSTLRLHSSLVHSHFGWFELCVEGQQHRRDAGMAFNNSVMSMLRDTVRAANSGDALSQAVLGGYHVASAKRLDILQGAPADDDMVAARWPKALRILIKAAAQGDTDAQTLCAEICATGGRSVLQNWTTAAKWWRKAAAAGERDALWYMGLCYYYGRGVDRGAAQAMAWFRKAAAQGWPAAADAVQAGIPGHIVREDIALFTNAGSAPPRYAAAHHFAGMVN
jgi:hypothetical protein